MLIFIISSWPYGLLFISSTSEGQSDCGIIGTQEIKRCMRKFGVFSIVQVGHIVSYVAGGICYLDRNIDIECNSCG